MVPSVCRNILPVRVVLCCREVFYTSCFRCSLIMRLQQRMYPNMAKDKNIHYVFLLVLLTLDKLLCCSGQKDNFRAANKYWRALETKNTRNFWKIKYYPDWKSISTHEENHSLTHPISVINLSLIVFMMTTFG